MPFTTQDRLEVADLVMMHGHLVDAGELDRLDELFTTDVCYDTTGVGGGVIHGTATLREAALALGDGNPVAHHVTNLVITADGDDRARAVSKGLGISANGGCASVTYRDTAVRTGQGWRISARTIIAHRQPLGRSLNQDFVSSRSRARAIRSQESLLTFASKSCCRACWTDASTWSSPPFPAARQGDRVQR